MPYGFLLKLADEKDLKLTGDEYASQQKTILSKTNAQDFLKYRNIVETNYNYISILTLYVEAYFNIAEYLSTHYGDTDNARFFLNKAIQINPLYGKNATINK